MQCTAHCHSLVILSVMGRSLQQQASDVTAEIKRKLEKKEKKRKKREQKEKEL